MNIYKIHRISRTGYDEAIGFVIRAENVAKARLIAKDNCGDEDRRVWTHADILLIGTAENGFPEEVILRDFRHG